MLLRMLALALIFVTVSCSSIETRTKIVIYDTGVNFEKARLTKFACKSGHKSFVSTPWYVDEQNHGTLVAELATAGLDPAKYCIISIKWIGESDDYEDGERSLRYISHLRFSYINMSFSYVDSIPHPWRYEAMVKRGVHLFVSAGNDRLNLDVDPSYPASYRLDPRYFHVIGALDTDFYGTEYSNYGSVVQAKYPGRYKDSVGTSFSAPRALNAFIKGIYPR